MCKKVTHFGAKINIRLSYFQGNRVIKARVQLAFTMRAHCPLGFNKLPTRMTMSFSTELLSNQSAPQPILLHEATAAQMEFLQDAEIPFNSILSAYQCSINHSNPQKPKVFSLLTSTWLSPSSIQQERTLARTCVKQLHGRLRYKIATLHHCSIEYS